MTVPCEKKTKQSGHLEPGMEDTVSSEKKVDSMDNGIQGRSATSMNNTGSTTKGGNGQNPRSQRDVYYQPSYYNYYYPGYGSYGPWDTHSEARDRTSMAPQSGYSMYPANTYAQYAYQKPNYSYGGAAMGDRTKGRMFSNNSQHNFRGQSIRKSVNEVSEELRCGPRINRTRISSDPSSENILSELDSQRDKYNRKEFPIEYESAKFYIIKSYSEDDVHKSIKYDVWSSTPNGNKRLNAAFHEVEAKVIEAGKTCPIFLLFSVNASGQFVGLAEMVGKVDFNKNMDFWQTDKWSGFFPVKWHIVKDIPNSQLRHILLHDRDNRNVTYTRDTEEIGLTQGLQMLKVFKSYPAKSSLLDDFEFYENREKSLQARKYGKPAALDAKHEEAEGKDEQGDDMRKTSGLRDPISSLVKATKNLSVNSSEKKAVV